VVAGDVNHEAVHAFERSHARAPTREELLEVHRVWINNEILYREGLKLPPGEIEAKDREQVIFKALAAINERVKPASVADDELRRWFEGRRDKYEQSARFDFEDAALAGPSTEATVLALTDRLNGGASADAGVNLRVFKGRPASNLLQSYGPEVAGALAKAEPGKWLPLRARDGWRALRLIARTAISDAAFETQRDAIRRDWLARTAADRRDAAVRALWTTYKIELDDTFRCAADQ